MAQLLYGDRLGQQAVDVETGTTARTGTWSAIQLLTATTFALLTDSAATGDAMTGIAFTAGMTIYGQFTAFTLTSGAVRAYK